MKKYLLMILIVTTASCLIGCGKKDVNNELSKSLQEEYGFTKEEADEWAELSEEFYDESKEDIEHEMETERLESDAENAFILYDVSSEIQKSKIIDEMVQINDSVIPNDASLCVRDLYNILSKYGPVTIQDGYDQVTEDSICQPSPNNIFSYRFIDEFGQDICWADVVNESEQISTSFDNKIVNIRDPGRDSMNVMNFYYPGNICAAQFAASDKIKETEAYTKLSANFEDDTIQNFEDILRTKGAPAIELLEDHYEINVFSNKPVYCYEDYGTTREMYRATCYIFYIDMSTAKVNSMHTSCIYNIANEHYKWSIKDVSLIDAELKNKLETLAADELGNEFVDKCDGEVSVEGCFIWSTGFGDPELYAIILTDRDTYEAVKFGIVQHFDGTYDIAESSISLDYGGPHESIDSLINLFEIDKSKVTWMNQ